MELDQLRFVVDEIFVVDTLNLFDEKGLLEVADPDESGVRRLALTEAG